MDDGNETVIHSFCSRLWSIINADYNDPLSRQDGLYRAEDHFESQHSQAVYKYNQGASETYTI